MNAVLKESLEKKGRIINQMEAVVNSVDGPIPDDKRSQFDQWDNELEALNGDIQRMQKLEDLKRKAAEERAYTIETKDEKKAPGKEELRAKKIEALNAYAKFGKGGMTEEQRSILAPASLDQRAQTSTNAAGGFTIDSSISDMIEKHILYAEGMFDACRIMRTAQGGQITVPTVNDTAVNGVLSTEGAADAATGATDFTFGSAVLNAYTYHSEFLQVSMELLRDSAFDLELEVFSLLGERLNRKANLDLTLADGSAKPTGIVTATTGTVTAALAGAIGRADLLNLQHGVNRAYRRTRNNRMEGQGGVGYMFADSTIKAIKLLTIGSGDDRPLWVPSMREGEPDTIEGFPYWVNDDVAAIAASASSALFGDFDKYRIRLVNNYSFIRSDERFIDNLNVGFIAFASLDGELTNTAAVKKLVHPAT